MDLKFSDVSTAITSAYVVSPHFFHIVAVIWKAGVVHAAGFGAICVACVRRWL